MNPNGNLPFMRHVYSTCDECACGSFSFRQVHFHFRGIWIDFLKNSIPVVMKFTEAQRIYRDRTLISLAIMFIFDP